MPSAALDAERLGRFERRMVDALNGAATALMTSIGHRTGLFDVMSRLPPSSSDEIASEAGLDPRYVREWLFAMASAGLVEYRSAEERYALPAEHAALLTRGARSRNVAASCQWIPLLGSVEERLVECFERGGGVPHAAYDRHTRIMAEQSDHAVVSALVERVVPLVDGLPEALARGIDVLEVGCGSGRALNRLAAEYPRSRFTGYEISAEAIDSARAVARELGLANAHFARRDAAALGHAREFDLVVALYSLHDQARPDLVLSEIATALRSDGVFLMQDLAASGSLREDASLPLAPFLYTLSCLHCMPVSLAEGGLGLGAMWGSERARRMLRDAGFGRVAVRLLPNDPINVYYVARK